MGLGGTVLRSIDAGDTWCALNVTATDLYAAEAVNNTEFLVAGADGLLMRTTNGGGLCSASGIGLSDLQRFPPVSLTGPFPQPSNDFTILRLRTTDARSFRTDVFDASGRAVITLPEARAAVGEHVIHLDTRDWAGGMYLVKVRSGDWEGIRRVVVTR